MMKKFFYVALGFLLLGLSSCQTTGRTLHAMGRTLHLAD